MNLLYTMLIENCGIAGIKGNNNVGMDLVISLKSLQHRGQEAAGIAITDKEMYLYKKVGLVEDIFKPHIIRNLSGNVGIGHVRYSTKGSSVSYNAQPFKVKTNRGDIAVAHNGEVVNADNLRNKLSNEGVVFSGTTDSEVIAQLLGRYLEIMKNPIKAIRKLMEMIKGGYSLVILINTQLFAVRDPYGIRPIIIGKYDNGYAVASESVVMDHLNGEMIRDMLPGEVIELTETGVNTLFIKEEGKAHCMFEWVYFSRPDAIIENKLSYYVRIRLGEILAEEKGIDADIVIPVPDSGRPHALGFSRKSGIPFEEGLMKNRYTTERTFIMPDSKTRDETLKKKLNPIKKILEGKRVVLCDDSIVRGTTMKKIVSLIKGSGAVEVHVRIGSPPIISPCYYGIDMKSRDELIAPDKSEKEIAEIIGADSVGYISIDGLARAIGIKQDFLCLGCVTEKYPVKVGNELLRGQKQLFDFATEKKVIMNEK
ncbi:MAG: amidophosphoribosyltransferase [Candidatus Thermoplasmatota archaeon]|nr:amidophosphoribosyltransferase [Candidatus Thermoplasmatota archaeon]MCL5963969.1 amidophosphoribosyltransferase [Candidatus Thermoplasmatota archaeon]